MMLILLGVIDVAFWRCDEYRSIGADCPHLRSYTSMGVLSTLFPIAVATGVLIYVTGRKGLVRFAKGAGEILGSYVARSRRHRARMQRAIVESESPEQKKTSMKLQRNLWELRIMLNEVTMVRSLSPRLLHKGNFGFTTEELMAAIGIRPELAV